MTSREVAVYPSAARTATPAAVTYQCSYARGIQVVVDVTAVGVTPTITVKIDSVDATSGKFYNLLTSAGISAVSTTVLRIYPGATVAAGLAANDCLAEAVRITVTHTDATTITYSVSAHLIQ